ncbi:hypothetical protein AXG89_41645 (plasmid) [Burkholderia sp. PAMC 26561]|nr:hypothetical protein AXG89_41645 [Burkholderia sp. PAMC 26561]
MGDNQFAGGGQAGADFRPRAHARRDAALTKRHTELFTANWISKGTLIQKIFPNGKAPATRLEIGAMVMELTFGTALQCIFIAAPPRATWSGLRCNG